MSEPEVIDARMTLALRLLAEHDAATVELECLSPRQAEVLRLTLKGYTARDIAGAMGLSIKTVESHVAGAQTKLNRTRVEVAALAAKAGWV